MVTNTKRRKQKKNIRKTSKSLVGGLSLFKKKSEKALQKKVKVINLHDLKTLVFSNKDILDNLMKTLIQCFLNLMKIVYPRKTKF